MAQQAAYAANLPLPNIMGMAFSYMYYTAIMYPAVAIAVCCFAKSKRMKMVGKMALPASFFGISEPLVFGLPIVFNPILAIPFIFIPSIVMGIAYLITSLGLVATPIGVQVFNIPLAINGILNGSWTIAILQILLLILSVIKFLKSKKYAAIKTQSVTDQWIDFVPMIVVACIVLFFLWWILMFVFAGIAFQVLK